MVNVSIRRLIRRTSKMVGGKIDAASEMTEFVELKDEPASVSGITKIPAQLFQTGPRRLIDPKHFQVISAFRQENNDLDHFFFDNDETDAYMREVWGDHPIWSIYERSVFGQMRADIFRYCVIYDRGGFYLDLNKTIPAKLSSFVGESSRGLISFEKNDLIVLPDFSVAKQLEFPTKVVLQWSFGFSANHPILDLAINRIVELEELFVNVRVRRALHGVVSFTGPGVFTWAVHKYAEAHGLEQITQVAPDFNDLGVTRIRESDKAFTQPHYGPLKDQIILKGSNS